LRVAAVRLATRPGLTIASYLEELEDDQAPGLPCGQTTPALCRAFTGSATALVWKS
jgi:hypothetical protein